MTSVRDILLRFDEVGTYEGSTTLDYEALRRSIDRLHKRLNHRFARILVLDDQIQDASFQCDIELPQAMLLKAAPNLKCVIRLSNFGKLASLCFEELLSAGSVDMIKDELASEGFIYIPYEELDVEYDGQFEEFKKLYGDKQKSTWWIRYFDYI